MRNLVRRVKRPEQQRFDVTGLVPRSEEWYQFYWEKLDRGLEGEDIGMRIPLEVTDEMIRRYELAEQEEKAADPEGYAAAKLAEQRERELECRDDWCTVPASMRDRADLKTQLQADSLPTEEERDRDRGAP